jgi:hypothetical protein
MWKNLKIDKFFVLRKLHLLWYNQKRKAHNILSDSASTMNKYLHSDLDQLHKFEEGKSTNQRKEHNHIDVELKQVHQLPKLHHGACTNQMREYKELTFPLWSLQNIQDHIWQEQKEPPQQVLSSLYPNHINHE